MRMPGMLAGDRITRSRPGTGITVLSAEIRRLAAIHRAALNGPFPAVLRCGARMVGW